MRKKFAERGFLGGSTFAGIKKNRVVITELGESLPAGTARHGGCVVEIGYGYGLQADAGAVLCNGACDSALLRATGKAVGAVFDIATGDDFAVGKQKRRADAEAAVRRVRMLGDGSSK